MNTGTKTVLLTADGLQKLQDELEHLKTVRRKENTAAIKRALSFGDLSENSEYDDAKNEQAEIERRIDQIEGMLGNYTLIDESAIDTKRVSVGSKVEVQNKADKSVAQYSIVGSTEADPFNNRISDESPLGMALLGHKIGETVSFEAPAGTISYKIKSISK